MRKRDAENRCKIPAAHRIRIKCFMMFQKKKDGYELRVDYSRGGLSAAAYP